MPQKMHIRRCTLDPVDSILCESNHIVQVICMDAFSHTLSAIYTCSSQALIELALAESFLSPVSTPGQTNH